MARPTVRSAVTGFFRAVWMVFLAAASSRVTEILRLIAWGAVTAAGLLAVFATWQWVIPWGVGALIMGVVIEISQKIYKWAAEKSDELAYDTLRYAFETELAPVIRKVAAMAAEPTPFRRRAPWDSTLEATVSAVRFLFSNIDRCRVVIYELRDADKLLHPVKEGGRPANPARPHVSGTPRGDAAIATALGTLADFVPDTSADPTNPRYGGSGGYKTYISVPISAGSASYGLLSVDAPEPGSLTIEDARTLTLVAAILATGFAVARQRV